MKYIFLLIPLMLGLQACNLAKLTAYELQPTATRTATLTQPVATATKANTCTVTASDALNLRAGAGLNYSVIAWLKAGEVLTLTGTQPRGAWIEVTTPSGRKGWIHSEYCQ